jgi:hypothetical protein
MSILYRSGSLITAAKELAKNTLDIFGVQKVKWDRGGTVKAGDYNSFYGKGNENLQLVTGFFVHQRIVSTVNTLRTGSFKLFKRPFPGFLTILTL